MKPTISNEDTDQSNLQEEIQLLREEIKKKGWYLPDLMKAIKEFGEKGELPGDLQVECNEIKSYWLAKTKELLKEIDRTPCGRLVDLENEIFLYGDGLVSMPAGWELTRGRIEFEAIKRLPIDVDKLNSTNTLYLFLVNAICKLEKCVPPADFFTDILALFDDVKLYYSEQQRAYQLRQLIVLVERLEIDERKDIHNESHDDFTNAVLAIISTITEVRYPLVPEVERTSAISRLQNLVNINPN